MYITGMSTEHCTIFSVISGLHDFTTDHYCTQPRHYCSPSPTSTGLLPRIRNVKGLIHGPYVEVLLLLPYTLAATRRTDSLLEVVADISL